MAPFRFAPFFADFFAPFLFLAAIGHFSVRRLCSRPSPRWAGEPTLAASDAPTPRHALRSRTREVLKADSADRLCGWRRRRHVRRGTSSPQQLNDPEALVAALESLDTLVYTSCGVDREYRSDHLTWQQWQVVRSESIGRPESFCLRAQGIFRPDQRVALALP